MQMGGMVCYDALVAPLLPQPLRRLFPVRHPRRLPHLPPQHPLKPHHTHPPAPAQPPPAKPPSGAAVGRHSGGASPAAVAAAATELLQQVAAAANGSGDGGSSGGGALDAASRRLGVRLKLQRMAIAAVAVLLYVKARSWLAGDQVGLAGGRAGGGLPGVLPCVPRPISLSLRCPSTG